MLIRATKQRIALHRANADTVVLAVRCFFLQFDFQIIINQINLLKMKTFNFITNTIFFGGILILLLGFYWIYDLSFNHPELINEKAFKAFITCIIGLLVMVVGSIRRTR